MTQKMQSMRNYTLDKSKLYLKKFKVNEKLKKSY